LTPLQSITTCLRKSFDFSGRATRAEFWWFATLIGSLMAILFPFEAVVNAASVWFGVLGAIMLLLLLLPAPFCSAVVRRYRDAGLWPTIPAILPIWVFASPAVAILIDQSAFGFNSKTEGMPELLFAGLGYIPIASVVFAFAMLPSKNSVLPAREHEVTP
jgi:uncharacterized membrane protein YhaH (DUF805 family)